MASITTRNPLPKFDSIRNQDEEIIWTGKPKLMPFILSGLWSGVTTIIFATIWFAVGTQAEKEGTGDWFLWVGLLPVLFFIFNFIKRASSFHNTWYAYSDKRVMMRTGAIGTDFKIIDYDKISDIEVTVNVIEKAYKVGTIKFFSGRTQTDEGITTKLYDTWEAIQNPYEVFKQLKQVIVDIKTDYQYPNALRPDLNPSYNTKYSKEN